MENGRDSSGRGMASASRGYLAPIGFALLMLVLLQLSIVLGWGGWFPWAVPALASGAAGSRSDLLGPAAYWLVGLTSLAGVAATVAWWRFADQTT